MSQKRLEANRRNAVKGGRPVLTATLYAQQFREKLAKQIMKDSKSWLTAIEDAAKGHFIIKQTEDGEIKVYKKSPDPMAWEKAMNRAFGKPQETVNLQNNGGSFDNSGLTKEEAIEVANAIKNMGMSNIVDVPKIDTV